MSPEILTDASATDTAPMADQSSIPDATPEPKEPQSRSAGDSVKAAMDKVLSEEKPEEKPAKAEAPKGKQEKAEKAAPDADGDADEVEDAEVGDKKSPETDAKDKRRRDGDDKPANIPARLLPKAREVWMNTPRVVQAEFERMEREHQGEVEQYREAKQFADEVAEYRQMAQQAGTSVKAALDRYVAMDRQIAQDFGRGIAAIASDQGKAPGEAIASLLAAYGITPQQYAQHVTQNPQAQYAAPQQAQQPRPDPAGQQALQELQEIKRAMQIQQIETQIIAPILPQMPRYAELQEDIAFFLNSGKVPSSLSPADRVLTAYDMAERLSPSPVSADREYADPDPAPASTAGRKSISGAPSNGTRLKGKPKIMSLKESIDDALRRV
jgi:hypothetical protein